MPAAGFGHAIFVSYAHTDNKPLYGSGEPWVSELVIILEERLRQLLALKRDCPLVWMDPMLAGNEPLSEAIVSAIENTAILLVILSPSYIASEWCQRERNKFLEVVGKYTHKKSRIFIIEKDEVDDLPAELGDLIPYRFWVKEKIANYNRPLASKDEEYRSRFDNLCHDLHKELKELASLRVPIVQREAKSVPGSHVAPKPTFAQGEEHASSLDFESEISRAALLIRLEDYAEATRILQERSSGINAPRERRNVANLLSRFADFMGGAPEGIIKTKFPGISRIAISPSGRVFAAAGKGGTLALIDVKTGELIKRLHGHADPIAGVVFGPRGDFVLSAAEGPAVIFWQIPSGDKLREIRTGCSVSSVAISPIKERFALAETDGRLRIIHSGTDEILYELAGHTPSSHAVVLAFSHDGSLLASGSNDGFALVWDLDLDGSERLQRLQPQRSQKLHNGSVTQVVFSRDSSIVATGGSDKSAWLWEWESDSENLLLAEGHKGALNGLAYGDSDRLLVSSSNDRSIRVWDSDSGATLRVFQAHGKQVTSMLLRDNVIYSSGKEDAIYRWRVDSGGLRLLDVAGPAACAVIAPGGTAVAAGLRDGGIQVFDLVTGELKWERREAHKADTRLAFSPDGKFLATAGQDESIRVWRAGSGRPNGRFKSPDEHDELEMYGLTFARDGQFVVAGNRDGRILFYRTDKKDERPASILDGHVGRVLSLSTDFSGEMLLSTGDDGAARLWHLDGISVRPVSTFRGAEGGFVQGAISPDGRYIAVGASDQTINVIEINGWKNVMTLHGGDGDTCSIIFSPDSKQIITANSDGTVRFFYFLTGEELFVLRIPTTRNEPDPPFLDFDFRSVPAESSGCCWLAVPLTQGKRGRRKTGGRLVLYKLGHIYD